MVLDWLVIEFACGFLSCYGRLMKGGIWGIWEAI